MVSMHGRMVLLAGLTLGVAACATGDSTDDGADAAARSPAVVAASPPLPGFSADVPAGLPLGAPVVLPPSTPRQDTTALRDSAGRSTTAGSTVATARGTAAAPAAGGTSTASAPAGTSANAGTTTGSQAPRSAGPGSPLALAAGEISTATGVFTAAQAERGREVYTNSCARCHMESAHSGGTFASTWHSRRVSDLYELLSNTMPLDNPGSLTEQQ